MSPKKFQSPAQLLPYGPQAFLIQGGTLDQRRAWTEALDSSNLPHFEEWVMGYDSLLLKFTEASNGDDFLSFLEGITAESISKESRHHVIEVLYDGPDLERVAEHTGLPTDEIIRRHSEADYRVRFLGFAPGFAYLDGLPAELNCPRLDSPRPRMQPGAVAIGGAHAGIYPSGTPGGWNWIGTTPTKLLKTDHCNQPFLLAAGDRVKFTPK